VNIVFITSFATPLVAQPSAVLKRNFRGFCCARVMTCIIICAAKKLPVSGCVGEPGNLTLERVKFNVFFFLDTRSELSSLEPLPH
jgi:hypothetical protein